MTQPMTCDELLAPPDDPPRDARAAFEQYGDFVWRVLQRLGVHDADREDITQEVFVVVHRQIGGFDGRSRMTTWLYGIAYRVVSTHRRRAWVRRELPTADVPETAAAAAGPEQAVSDAEERQKLGEVLDLMDLEKRAVFVMHELDELSCDEIAAALAIPVGTVHSRLHHARDAFRAALKRWHAQKAAQSASPKRRPWPFGRST